MVCRQYVSFNSWLWRTDLWMECKFFRCSCLLIFICFSTNIFASVMFFHVAVHCALIKITWRIVSYLARHYINIWSEWIILNVFVFLRFPCLFLACIVYRVIVIHLIRTIKVPTISTHLHIHFGTLRINVWLKSWSGLLRNSLLICLLLFRVKHFFSINRHIIKLFMN
jgi:hypothetical protein